MVIETSPRVVEPVDFAAAEPDKPLMLGGWKEIACALGLLT